MKEEKMKAAHIIQSLMGCSSMPSHSWTRALSKMTLPSLYLNGFIVMAQNKCMGELEDYLWLSSVANSYIQPSLESQFLQYTSLTGGCNKIRENFLTDPTWPCACPSTLPCLAPRWTWGSPPCWTGMLVLWLQWTWKQFHGRLISVERVPVSHPDY